MTGENNTLNVGNYRLEPLLTVRQDNVSFFLGHAPGVYICDCPETTWYEHFKFNQKHGISGTKRKHYIFNLMGKGSKWLSPTGDVPMGKITTRYESGDILHLGYLSLPLRFGQILQTVSLFLWLWRHRTEYEYCLVYNFYLPVYLAPFVIKLLLRKRLYIDYEDDYTKQRKSRFKNFFENVLKKTVTGALCINAGMARDFQNKPVCVLNAFSDLGYLKTSNFSLRENMVFLFSGTFDEVRGIQMVPALVEALRKQLEKFSIIITGAGPLLPLVQSWTYPEVRYLGFLNNQDYADIIKKTDACLVLQKPDHPFTWGSFPSKIDEYAEYKKPIFILR